jgi:hypothetical protein
MAEVSDKQVLQWFSENNVDAIRDLLVNETMPTNLISMRYAKSIEMATLLQKNGGADPFEYIDDGKIALDECGKYFNIHPFLPQSQNESVRDVVKKLQKIRDGHLALCPDIKIEFEIRQIEERPTTTMDELTEILKIMKRDPDGFLKKIAGKKRYRVELGQDVDLEQLYTQLFFEGFVPMFKVSGFTDSFIVAVGDNDKYVSFDELDMVKYLEDEYLRRYDKRTRRFWHGVRYIKPIIHYWTYFSANTLDQHAQESPESFPMIINGYFNKVFQESRRAKTQMQMFRTIDSKTINNIPEPQQMIPVTRYAQGMKKGLFFSALSKKTWCGTFYYQEPESRVFLQYKKKLVAKDKREAAEMLGIRSTEQINENVFEKALRIALSKKETASLMFTPREFIDFVKKHDIQDHTTARFNYMINGPPERLMKIQIDRKYYCGRLLRFYALQDFLDQPICTAAFEQGYDIVVFTHMVGSRQIVTEVLDVRSREDSFANLHFLL